MSLVEWVGFVTGALCVYLIVKEKDINWPIGLLNSLALLVVFWRRELYAQSGLQVFYVAECLYGWWMWTRRDRWTGSKLIRIGRIRSRTQFVLTATGLVACILLIPIFRRTGDPAPFWDSVITAASLIAEYMLCLKLLEAWTVYFCADLISLALLAYLGEWVTLGTYVCFTILCVMGMIEWAKRLRSSSPAASSSASSTHLPKATNT